MILSQGAGNTPGSALRSLVHMKLSPGWLGCGLLLVLAAASRFAAVADPASVRNALLEAINAERARAGAPPLRLAAPLSSVAQAQAETLERRGDLRQSKANESHLDQEMVHAGYRAQRWVESDLSSNAPLAEIVEQWRDRGGEVYREVMGRDFRDVGIGVAHTPGGSDDTFYTFLFAVPERDYYEARTAGLKDGAAVRRAVLDRVNAERRSAGRRPLSADPRLDVAAERHAQDMLARGYFAHASPEGKTVRQRALAAGYKWHTIGENIAEGQLSVEEVMKSWMESPHHRENILSRDFTQMGLGVAMGEGPKGFRVEWVQTFGWPENER